MEQQLLSIVTGLYTSLLYDAMKGDGDPSQKTPDSKQSDDNENQNEAGGEDTEKEVAVKILGDLSEVDDNGLDLIARSVAFRKMLVIKTAVHPNKLYRLFKKIKAIANLDGTESLGNCCWLNGCTFSRTSDCIMLSVDSMKTSENKFDVDLSKGAAYISFSYHRCLLRCLNSISVFEVMSNSPSDFREVDVFEREYNLKTGFESAKRRYSIHVRSKGKQGVKITSTPNDSLVLRPFTLGIFDNYRKVADLVEFTDADLLKMALAGAGILTDSKMNVKKAPLWRRPGCDIMIGDVLCKNFSVPFLLNTPGTVSCTFH